VRASNFGPDQNYYKTFLARPVAPLRELLQEMNRTTFFILFFFGTCFKLSIIASLPKKNVHMFQEAQVDGFDFITAQLCCPSDFCNDEKIIMCSDH
jgi:hypothetical protein